MAAVAARVLPEQAGAEFATAADRIRDDILRRRPGARSAGAFAASYGGHDLDAALLQMASLRLLLPGRPAPAARRSTP